MCSRSHLLDSRNKSDGLASVCKCMRINNKTKINEKAERKRARMRCDMNNARSDKNHQAKGREREKGKGKRKKRDKRRRCRRGGKPEARAGAFATKVLLAYISRAAYVAQSISENLSRRIASERLYRRGSLWTPRALWTQAAAQMGPRIYTHDGRDTKGEYEGKRKRKREKENLWWRVGFSACNYRSDRYANG